MERGDCSAFREGTEETDATEPASARLFGAVHLSRPVAEFAVERIYAR